jgi:DNA repair protein RadC
MRNHTYAAKLRGCEFRIQRLNDGMPASTLLNGDTPDMIVSYLRQRLPASPKYNGDVENLIAVHLNTRKKIIGFEVISNGTIDTLLCHPREIFKSAIVLNAASIILAHNHPSGDPTPSEADIRVTRETVRAGQLLKIEVLDHIILGHDAHTSLRERGYFAF